ncbi:hypothetical protein LTR36_003532 [Oleoguttula mirabilis]|uniref:Uncharacterized protein n=1 Tax=Oleoguttula mirabilis TaxID=1507867 RepID=A0AAV9JLI1_9PEZI|nr:hypothetical protein LTR36_003532 [Oleoguttula mirabilis]
MSEALESNKSVPSPGTTRKPRALAELQFNNILAEEQGTSSEDEVRTGQGILPEDARTAIGISIGSQQTRLTSPKTPAIEKQAALDGEGDFFGGAINATPSTLPGLPADDEAVAEDVAEACEDERDVRATTLGAVRGDTTPEGPLRSLTPKPATRESEVRQPSPWRAEQQQTRKSRSLLPDGFLFSRRRANTGPESTLDGWQKALMSSLPSMPKHFNLSTPFGAAQLEGHANGAEASRKVKCSSIQRPASNTSPEQHTSLHSSGTRAGGDSKRLGSSRRVSSTEREEALAKLGNLPSKAELQPIRSRPSQLRRSTSDTSLVTQRTLSRVSSLGDDSRFDHVQDQVNSRIQALRDSWQDSNIKLPSLPSVPSFNLASFTPDFLRDRSGSYSRKHSTDRPEKSTDPMTGQPYRSAKAAAADLAANKATPHPQFNRALEQLEGDIVVLGGYRGSILRSAEPPHRQLWVPVKVGLNLRKVDLEVGIEADGDERATERIIPGGMLTHIGPVDISRRLFKRLRVCENARLGKLRVHDYGYDWRLDPGYLSGQLIAFLESLPCNKPGVARHKRGALVVAHSLGGLITRHAVNQRPDLFSGVVYAGVPNTCVNILGPMRNGDEVLLSSRVLTAQVNFTIRTSFALLPLDGRCFFDKHTKEEYPVDFFDPQTWVENRLSPCLARPLPPLSAPPKPSGITGYVSSMASALPSLPLSRKGSIIRSKTAADVSKATTAGGVGEPDSLASGVADSDRIMAEGNFDTSEEGRDPHADTSSSIRTAVTIPREEAIAYLTRTLAKVKKFKQELAFCHAHAEENKYPPVAVIYGKTTPTVYGARVDGREGIKHADAYDELAFASGDGVVLARAAMVPDGYTTARGGIISSDRGHVTLLGDLEAVGKCLNSVIGARRRGTGYGL